MNSQLVNPLLQQLASGGIPTVAGLAQILGTPLKPAQENPHWKFYSFELPSGPFKGGELRLSTAGERALVSLMGRDEAALLEDDINFKPWGAVRHIDINPAIPPEGTDAYAYDLPGVRLSFQFMHVSRRLRSATLEWGAKP